MMDNPFLDDPAEMMVREMEESEHWDEDEVDWPEDEEEDWDEDDIDRRPPIPNNEDELKGIDRNGVVVRTGDRIKLVGSRTESTVHFNGSMQKYLNTDKILTIKQVRPYSPHPCFKIHGGADWSWSHMNIEKVMCEPPKMPEPTLFDPKDLDL